MADRTDVYLRQRVTEAELDVALELLEKADRALAADVGIYGLISGTEPTPHAPVLDLTTDFFRTRLGQRYYESTLPKLVDQIGRLAVEVAALNETLARPGVHKSVGPGARQRVLIVHDDEKILRGFARALKRDYDVLRATSPGVALAMTEAHALDSTSRRVTTFGASTAATSSRFVA